jgi:hypothetical protein
MGSLKRIIDNLRRNIAPRVRPGDNPKAELLARLELIHQRAIAEYGSEENFPQPDPATLERLQQLLDSYDKGERRG